MKIHFQYIIVCIFFCSCAGNQPSVGTTDFNFDWEFKLLDPSKGVGASSEWSNVNLPHDWSVTASFDSINGEGATGYLPGGMGVYRKEFLEEHNDQTTTYLLFDGVYNNSEFYLNGKKLGNHPYGYSPFYFDITEHLSKSNDTNHLKVTVDRTRFVDSRWYTGSGIYRNVKYIRKNKLHIPVWGTFITTPSITNDEAKIQLEVKIKNNYNEPQDFALQIEIYDGEGTLIVKDEKKHSILSETEHTLQENVMISNPKLWGLDTPNRYNARINIVQGGVVIDSYDTPFGVRDIKFDANKGFFLNGKNELIKGVCLHHDGGLVGAAVPKDVWRRRFEKLKKAGCNAIRIAHNPGSEEFLDLCDEMGFLVQDEFFDEWDNPKDKRLNTNEKSVDAVTRGYTEHFQEWAEKDLKNTMLAHRNHPSIIQWSIGNEIEWTYPRNSAATGFFDNMNWSGNYFWEEPPHTIAQIKEKLATLPKAKYDIGKTAQKLAKWTRELDTTRYIIANCILPSASYESGYGDALDMIGYSYRRVIYDYGHRNYPNKPIMGTENLVQWHEWKSIEERPFISGTFLWTGIDYMGESNGQWPRKATESGMLDVAGFEKPSYHMMKTLWNKEPHIFMATQHLKESIFKRDKTTGEPVEKVDGAWKTALWVWHDVNEHWNYKKGDEIVTEVYSNCEEIELYLNDKSLGVKKLKDFEDRIYKWIVPYASGILKAVGSMNGKIIESKIITSGKPTSIEISVDKKELKADGYGVAHIVAQFTDKNGNPVLTENDEITFEIDGIVSMLGVDNGAATNVQDYQSNKIITNKGRGLLIIQSKKEKSKVTVRAKSGSWVSNLITIDII